MQQVVAGDVAWVLVSTILVLLMTIPGLALFYAGMVRKKNVLAIMMQSFSLCAAMTIVWVIAGYSLSFTNGTGALAPYICSPCRAISRPSRSSSDVTRRPTSRLVIISRIQLAAATNTTVTTTAIA